MKHRSTYEDTFSIQNIRACEDYVFSMQQKLDRAVADDNSKAIRKTFDALVRQSMAVKTLAVYRITYTNSGKYTAGVDGISTPKGYKSETDNFRYKLLKDIDIFSKPYPIKRVFIPKPNGKQRPLGIPTLKDRITQEILRIGIEPIAEYHFHDSSYGFRPKRSCQDVQESLFKFLAQSNRKRYILEGDIKSCFDNISHSHIIKTLKGWHIPEYTLKILQKIITSEVIHNFKTENITKGTPQGGVISPLLCNVAMNCFDYYIATKYGKVDRHGGKHYISPMIRYADDFVILCKSKTEAHHVKEDITEFLHTNIGLTLSHEKTKITHIKDGFDFVGFNLRKYRKHRTNKPKSERNLNDYVYLAKPQREKSVNLIRNCKDILKNGIDLPQDVIIGLLNLKLRGWGNYYRHVVSKEVFSFIDNSLFHLTLKWGKRRHPNKSTKWVYQNYFQYEGKGKSKNFRTGNSRLYRLAQIPIIRHPKVAKGKRVYNYKDADYWKNREKRLANISLYYRHKTLYNKQKGLCAYCGYTITSEHIRDGHIELHHITPKGRGGKDSQSNLQL